MCRILQVSRGGYYTWLNLPVSKRAKKRNNFKEQLLSYKMIQSMTAKGNCWDNAVAESFFATLKKELVYRANYKTRQEARQSVY